MTDPAFWTKVLHFSEETSHRIGEELSGKFGKLEAVRKDDGSLVTEADRWSDAEIRQAIAQTFPDHGVLSEETEHIFPEQDWCWVIDPIDGTTNFTRGIPIWGICMGLLYKGTPVFGYVHFPWIRQSFHGYWYGDSGLTGPTGAFCNGEPIQTSADEPSFNHIFNLCARSTAVAAQPDFPCKIRLMGVASYNMLIVAMGAALGGVEATPKIWDIAAVWSIVQAAGGAIQTLEPKPVFPLTVGKDYGDRPFPCLTASRAALIPVFQPFVQFIGDDICKKYDL
jgi:myo-inositol-1(or 4)-monophosphatase